MLDHLGRDLHQFGGVVHMSAKFGEAVAGLLVANNQADLLEHLERGFVDLAGLVIIEEGEELHREGTPLVMSGDARHSGWPGANCDLGLRR